MEYNLNKSNITEMAYYIWKLGMIGSDSDLQKFYGDVNKPK
jgi:hypothetical protein